MYPTPDTTVLATAPRATTRSRRQLMAKRWLVARVCASFGANPFARGGVQTNHFFGVLPLLDLWASRRRRRGRRAQAVVACSIIDHETLTSWSSPLTRAQFLSEKPVLLHSRARARDVIAGAWGLPRDFQGPLVHSTTPSYSAHRLGLRRARRERRLRRRRGIT